MMEPMDPRNMTPRQIAEVLGIDHYIRIVNDQDGGGFISPIAADTVSWQSPADFARLVESRRVKPWEEANDDDELARRAMIPEDGSWLAGVWKSISIDGLTPSVLARIGFRKVMADIEGKGKPVDPPKDQPLTWVEVAEWLRRGKSDGSRESIAPSTKPGEFFVDGKFNHQTRWYTLPELTALVRGTK